MLDNRLSHLCICLVGGSNNHDPLLVGNVWLWRHLLMGTLCCAGMAAPSLPSLLFHLITSSSWGVHSADQTCQLWRTGTPCCSVDTKVLNGCCQVSTSLKVQVQVGRVSMRSEKNISDAFHLFLVQRLNSGKNPVKIQPNIWHWCYCMMVESSDSLARPFFFTRVTCCKWYHFPFSLLNSNQALFTCSRVPWIWIFEIIKWNENSKVTHEQ